MVSRINSAGPRTDAPRLEVQQREERRATNGVALEQAEPDDSSRAPFWKPFTAQVHALPDEVFVRLAEDGASEVDHYLYGAPKRRA